MFSALVAGVMFGLSAGVSPGPLMTLVVTHAMRHNVREGVLVALAPLITDAPIILGALFIVSRLTHFEPALGIVAAVGGLYVLYLSCETLRLGPLVVEAGEARPRSLGKGVLVNALNPHPYLFWATVGGPFILAARENGPLAPWLFVASFFLFLVGSKILIAILAGRFRSFLAGKAYTRMMQALGVALAVFAALLFRKAYALLT